MTDQTKDDESSIEQQFKDITICSKCDQILLFRPEREKSNGKEYYVIICQDCKYKNIFKETILHFSNVEDIHQEPPNVENYKYDDTIINGIIVYNDRYYDTINKKFIESQQEIRQNFVGQGFVGEAAKVNDGQKEAGEIDGEKEAGEKEADGKVNDKEPQSQAQKRKKRTHVNSRIDPDAQELQ